MRTGRRLPAASIECTALQWCCQKTHRCPLQPTTNTDHPLISNCSAYQWNSKQAEVQNSFQKNRNLFSNEVDNSYVTHENPSSTPFFLYWSSNNFVANKNYSPHTHTLPPLSLPVIEFCMCLYLLSLSPSQCPPNTPLPGNVDREITSDRFPSTVSRALKIT